MPAVIRGDLYDFPKYYDLLFGSDWKAEFEFLQACFQRHAARRIRRVFEPACGTGRLLIKLAQAGFEVSGNDLNPKAVRYCNDRLRRHGFPASVAVGDMADFRVRRPCDAGFNMINSFRHLPTEERARAHLGCMAEATAPGGLYLLGLHLIPTRGSRCEDEFWTARRGNLSINSYMWSKGIDRRRRMERLGMRFDVYTPTRQFRIEDEMHYRTYSAAQMQRLLADVSAWELVETYDFTYDVDQPVVLGPRTEDVVYVLRKR
jgi:SAM-dependent methyltransferase